MKNWQTSNLFFLFCHNEVFPHSIFCSFSSKHHCVQTNWPISTRFAANASSFKELQNGHWQSYIFLILSWETVVNVMFSFLCAALYMYSVKKNILENFNRPTREWAKWVSETVNVAKQAYWSKALWSEWVEWAVWANEHSELPSGLFKTRLSLTRNAPLEWPSIL